MGSGPNYQVVKADDWVGIYINGDLYYEGHDIPIWVWMDLLDEELVDRKVNRDDVESDHAYKVIQGHGRCPEHWPNHEEYE